MPKPPQASSVARNMFISYSHSDVAGVRELLKWLTPICDRLPGINVTWVDFEQLKGGDDWQSKIIAGLNAADVFIVMMSIDYVASEFCMQYELRHILKKVHRGQATNVIGIALRSSRLQDYSVNIGDVPQTAIGLSAFQCLPQAEFAEGNGTRLGLRALDSWEPHQKDKAWMLLAIQLEEALCRFANSIIQSAGLSIWQKDDGKTSSQALARSADVSASSKLRADWLPYLADRRDQFLALVFALRIWKSKDYKRPLVILTEGRSEDCLPKWTARLHQFELVKILDLGDHFPQFGHYKSAPWPSAAGLANNNELAAELFRVAIASALSCSPTLSEREFFKAARGRMQPALLWMVCKDSQDAEAAIRGLNGLLRVLNRWPDANIANMLAISVSIVRPENSPAGERAALASVFEAALISAEKRGAIQAAILGSLPELDEIEIFAWAQEHAADCLLKDIGVLCPSTMPSSESGSWSMRVFAESARAWIVPE